MRPRAAAGGGLAADEPHLHQITRLGHLRFYTLRQIKNDTAKTLVIADTRRDDRLFGHALRFRGHCLRADGKRGGAHGCEQDERDEAPAVEKKASAGHSKLASNVSISDWSMAIVVSCGPLSRWLSAPLCGSAISAPACRAAPPKASMM